MERGSVDRGPTFYLKRMQETQHRVDSTETGAIKRNNALPQQRPEVDAGVPCHGVDEHVISYESQGCERLNSLVTAWLSRNGKVWGVDNFTIVLRRGTLSHFASRLSSLINSVFTHHGKLLEVVKIFFMLIQHIRSLDLYVAESAPRV